MFPNNFPTGKANKSKNDYTLRQKFSMFVGYSGHEVGLL